MRRLLTASLKGHARRFVAGGIAIVLSVAYVCAVLIAIDSTKLAIQRALGAQYSNADLVVTRADEQVDTEMLERVRNVEGVAAAAAAVIAYLDVGYPQGGTEFAPVGSVAADPELRWQQPTDGRLPEKAGEVAVTAGVAEDKGITIGETIAVRAGDSSAEQWTVVGIVPGGSLATSAELYAGESTLLEPRDGGVQGDLLVRLAEGADRAQVAPAVREAAGSGEAGGEATAVTAEEKVNSTLQELTGDIDILGGLLLGFAAIAMFVALLVVTNTFTIMVAQRSRELALFRCIGAAKRQVFAAVLAESALLGLAFSLLGALGGIGLAQATLKLVDMYTGLNLPMGVVDLRPVALLVPIALGLLTTVLAALPPARRATRVPPLAALHPEAALRVRSRAGAVRLVLGALFLLGGAATLVVGMEGIQGPSGILVAIGGGAASFLGVLLFAPILVPAVVRLLGLPARTGGVPGKVAVGNSVRNPRRTAATASALLIGVTLISLLAVGAESSQKTLGSTLNTQFPLDITASVRDALTGEDGGRDGERPVSLPGETAEAIANVPGIAATAKLYGASGRLGKDGLPRLISGVDVESGRAALRHSRPVDGLRNGVVALGPSVADSLALSEGDRLDVSVGDRSLTMRVRVINEVLTPEVMVTVSDLRRLAPDPVLVEVWAKAADGADPRAVIDGLEDALAGAPNAELGGSFPERALYAQVADILLMIASGLLGMAVAIALVGVGNTLSLSVLERTRENALLRALGLTRTQLRGTLGVEAVLIAGTAVLIGLALGVVYGYAGTAALMAGIDEVQEIQLAVPWSRLGLVALVAVGAGLLASVLPARRAAKVPPAAALGDE